MSGLYVELGDLSGGKGWVQTSGFVAFATGARPVPAYVDAGAVDSDLGAHVDARPRVVTDGGEDVQADSDGGDEPDDCDCGEFPSGGRCFRCYLGGGTFDD